jgi:glycerol uptake operon antiterminator
MNSKVQKIYENSFTFPIVYDMKDMNKVIQSQNTNVILLGRMLTILNAKRIVQHVKTGGKMAIVDVDLAGGLGRDENALQFIAKEVCADGIISTHRSVINQAKKYNLVTVLKIFVYDEFSLETALNTIGQCMPNVLEVLPGAVLPFVYHKIKERFDFPINASGFMHKDFKFIVQLLDIGVSAVHTNDPELWKMSVEELRDKARQTTT